VAAIAAAGLGGSVMSAQAPAQGPQRSSRPPSRAPARPAAQPAAKPSAPGDVETDPIRCWWKTDKSSVIVGERFTVTLTCGVVETSRVKVLPDMNQLEPTVVPLSPFEVVQGVRHEDIVAPPWRYFQDEYTVRLIGDAFFDKDVDLPALKVTYRIQSSVGGGSQGRDQTYVLPPLPMRVASLVPKKANDIRDASHDTFGDIEARQSRARVEVVAAVILFAFAAVLLALALARLVGRYRVRTPAIARPVPLGAVLRGCVGELRRVKADVARDGWSPQLASRALTALRVAGAVALGKSIAQTRVSQGTAVRDGQLAIRSGLIGSRRAVVSTPTTPDAIGRVLSNGNGSALPARTQAVLGGIQQSLRALGAARYGRNGHLDTTALDLALDEGIDLVRRLRVANLWPMRTADAVARSAADVGAMVWSR
jgi:hypothetical protein